MPEVKPWHEIVLPQGQNSKTFQLFFLRFLFFWKLNQINKFCNMKAPNSSTTVLFLLNTKYNLLLTSDLFLLTCISNYLILKHPFTKIAIR